MCFRVASSLVWPARLWNTLESYSIFPNLTNLAQQFPWSVCLDKSCILRPSSSYTYQLCMHVHGRYSKPGVRGCNHVYLGVVVGFRWNYPVLRHGWMLNFDFLTEDQLLEIHRSQLGLWVLLDILGEKEITTRGGIFSAATLLSFPLLISDYLMKRQFHSSSVSKLPEMWSSWYTSQPWRHKEAAMRGQEGSIAKCTRLIQ